MKNIMIAFVFIVTLVSCEKYVDLDLDELQPSLVPEALVTNDAAVSFVKLTMSHGFTVPDDYYQRITDAQVKIMDNQGNIINFTPDSEGVYRTTQNLIPGTEYTLNITKDHHRVTAVSTMPEQIVLTNFKRVTHQSETYLDLYFADDPDTHNYFYIKAYELNGGTYYLTHRTLINDFYYDRQTQSLRIDDLFFYGSSSTSYKIELYHITKETYQYYSTLNDASDVYGGPFSISVPGNPNTNTSNHIGHFATATVSALEKTSLD